MITRILRLTHESCPHDLFGTFRLSSKSVTFVPSELTKAFRDGDTLTVVDLHLVTRELARAVIRLAGGLQTIELGDGSVIERHPEFKVELLPAPDFKVSP